MKARAATGGAPPALFDREAYRCEPHPVVRLKELARVHRRPALSERLRREEEDHAAIGRLRAIASELAGLFKLRYVAIEPEQEGVVEHYGVCYRDGLIRIRLRHATTGRLLKESSLVDTLCHELAHLRHFDHSLRFRRFYDKVLGEARRRGHYRPGGSGAERERQRSLFDATGCGLNAPVSRRGEKR